jgi:hypothetical protein
VTLQSPPGSTSPQPPTSNIGSALPSAILWRQHEKTHERSTQKKHKKEAQKEAQKEAALSL